jgi:hypothetical protein
MKKWFNTNYCLFPKLFHLKQISCFMAYVQIWFIKAINKQEVIGIKRHHT